MSLQDSFLRFMQNQLEAQDLRSQLKQELEKILFENDFHFEKVYDIHNRYYIYPCITPSKPFQIIQEKISITENYNVTKEYILLNVENAIQISVKEDARFSKTKEHSFVLDGISGHIRSSFINKIYYSVNILDFDGKITAKFNFTQNIPDEKVLENFDETFSLSTFYDVLVSLTSENKCIENSFRTSLKKYLPEDDIPSFEYLLENSVDGICVLKTDSNISCDIFTDIKEVSKKIMLDFKCNLTDLVLTGYYRSVTYNCRVLLTTPTTTTSIDTFSYDDYLIPELPAISDKDKEFEVRKLFCL